MKSPLTRLETLNGPRVLRSTFAPCNGSGIVLSRLLFLFPWFSSSPSLTYPLTSPPRYFTCSSSSQNLMPASSGGAGAMQDETAHDMLAMRMTGQGTHKIFCLLLFLSLVRDRAETVATQTCLGRQSHSHKERGFPPSTLKSSSAHLCQTEPHSSPTRSTCP